MKRNDPVTGRNGELAIWINGHLLRDQSIGVEAAIRATQSRRKAKRGVAGATPPLQGDHVDAKTQLCTIIPALTTGRTLNRQLCPWERQVQTNRNWSRRVGCSGKEDQERPDIRPQPPVEGQSPCGPGGNSTELGLETRYCCTSRRESNCGLQPQTQTVSSRYQLQETASPTVGFPPHRNPSDPRCLLSLLPSHGPKTVPDDGVRLATYPQTGHRAVRWTASHPCTHLPR